MPESILLDTSALIDVEEIDRAAHGDPVVLVSAITIGELAFGIELGNREVRAARLGRVLREYEVLPYGVEEAKLYGALATLVRASGRNPRPRRLDLQIAATAAAARVPLLTCNPQDFRGTEPLVDVVAVRRAR